MSEFLKRPFDRYLIDPDEKKASDAWEIQEKIDQWVANYGEDSLRIGPSQYVHPNFTYDFDGYKLSVGGKSTNLPLYEQLLLRVLIQNENTTVPYVTALSYIWGEESRIGVRNLQALAAKLRDKIDPGESRERAKSGILLVQRRVGIRLVNPATAE